MTDDNTTDEKILLSLRESDLEHFYRQTTGVDASSGALEDPQSGETGLGFIVIVASVPEYFDEGLAALTSGGILLPFESDGERVYGGDDIIAGVSLPRTSTPVATLNVSRRFGSRPAFLAHARASTPPSFVTGIGASPLLGTITLSAPEVFHRYCSQGTDPALQGGALVKGTYLAPPRDALFVNTGFGAVGRFALPYPQPASNLFSYVLPKGAVLLVGTVAPNFGQAGGGVEVQIQRNTPVTSLTTTVIDDF